MTSIPSFSSAAPIPDPAASDSSQMGQPEEEQLGEQQPGERQPGAEQPRERQPAERQPAERQPAERQPAERQPAERQPAERQQPEQWQQGQLIELTIADLNHNGEGVGRWQNRVIFVPDSVPGDRLLVRLVRVKPQYAHGKIHQLLAASSDRVRPSCIVADKCGGCQWQHIAYPAQLAAKRNLIIQDLERIGGFITPPVDAILAPPDPALAYRNKSTYPFGFSSTRKIQAGYYQKGSHHLINLNQCPIQDARLDPLLKDIKQDIQRRGWTVYNETTHEGELRHLGLRIGRRTGEMLLILVVTTGNLPRVEAQAQEWLNNYPGLVGVTVNINGDRTNAILGSQTNCIAGRSYLNEEFAGLTFQIQPTTFFQVFTEQAEALLETMIDHLKLQGNEVLVDAYCGIGTLTLPLAKKVEKAIGIEVQPEAIEQARINAELNAIDNSEFCVGKVEIVLPNLSVHPDIVILDPPRKGCDPVVIQSLLELQPQRIVYVSCNASTLARDLKLLSHRYRLDRVQPADFFPQTAHVECAAFLVG